VLSGNPGASPEDGPAWVRNLCAEFSIPPLHSYGIREIDVVPLVERASRASSMKANPIALTRQELAAILTQAL
jgi:alcohol dehydrogenase class IV